MDMCLVLQFRCSGCGEQNEKSNLLREDESFSLPDGRGDANLVMKCKFCSRTNSAGKSRPQKNDLKSNCFQLLYKDLLLHTLERILKSSKQLSFWTAGESNPLNVICRLDSLWSLNQVLNSKEKTWIWNKENGSVMTRSQPNPSESTAWNISLSKCELLVIKIFALLFCSTKHINVISVCNRIPVTWFWLDTGWRHSLLML